MKNFFPIVSIALIMAACQTMSFILPDAEYVAQNGDLHTLRYTYGSVDEKEFKAFRESYDKKLGDKAGEICMTNDYEVVEKSRKPSTIANLKNIGENDYFWVVRCKSHTS